MVEREQQQQGSQGQGEVWGEGGADPWAGAGNTTPQQEEGSGVVGEAVGEVTVMEVEVGLAVGVVFRVCD